MLIWLNLMAEMFLYMYYSKLPDHRPFGAVKRKSDKSSCEPEHRPMKKF